jgi:hypothetical protein
MNYEKKLETPNEYNWNPFEPITIEIKKIEIADDFETMCRNWVVNNGMYEPSHKFYTSFFAGNEMPEFIKTVVNQLILPGCKLEDAWIQTYKPSGFHPVHDHMNDKNIYSGCLYLSKGESSIFQNPMLRNDHTSMPVECGTVLYWHPALFHCSAPSNKTRTIIAFNLSDDTNLEIHETEDL